MALANLRGQVFKLLKVLKEILDMGVKAISLKSK
jgi:hypothetical protein